MANLIDDTENLLILGIAALVIGGLGWIVWKWIRGGPDSPVGKAAINRALTGDPTVSAGEDLSRWWKNFTGVSDEDEMAQLAADSGTVPAYYRAPSAAQFSDELNQADKNLSDFITQTRNDPATLPFF